MENKMAHYKKTKEFLVCIDSDGCVFDTMDIKWKECFIPALIKHYKLQPIAKQVRQQAEEINLYSELRGINRFVGIPILFDTLEALDELKVYDFSLPDITELRNWISSGDTPSEISLKRAIDETESAILKHTLNWSLEVNINIKEMVVGIPPYPLAKETIIYLKEFCDIAIVSSTNSESLKSEWGEHGLLPYVDIICGQEMGTKSACIGMLKDFGYERDSILMVGDAVGDLNAAKENDVLFYPVIPRDEIESWRKFNTDIGQRFIEKRYKGIEENLSIDQFEKVLRCL